MPVDSVSELSLAPTGDANTTAPNTGRRRARRTTGASSASQTQVGESAAQPTQQPMPVAPPVPVHSLLLDGLEADDITDIPAGGHLPPIRLPPKPTRVVAPLPASPTSGIPNAGTTQPLSSEPPYFYVQKAHGFKKTKGWPAMFYGKRGAGIGFDGEQVALEEQRPPENELLEVGLIAQRVQQIIGTFICGFLAGLTAWYAIASQLLFLHLTKNTKDYLESEAFGTFIVFYQAISMPVGCVFYALLAFCLFTILDRYDVSFVTRNDVVQAWRFQNGAVPLILLYLAALVITLVCFQHDAKMYDVIADTFHPNIELFLSTSTEKIVELTTTTGSTIIPNGTLSTRPGSTPLPGQVVFQRGMGMSISNDSTRAMTTPEMRRATTETSNEDLLEIRKLFLADLGDSVTIWLRLNFARAACCFLAWLVMVITSDPDRLSAYLRSLMETPPLPVKVPSKKPTASEQNPPNVIVENHAHTPVQTPPPNVGTSEPSPSGGQIQLALPVVPHN